MPVTSDSFLWENTGFHFSGSTVVVTHPDAGGTTAGNTVLIAIHTSSVTTAPPAGFVKVGPTSTLQQVYVKTDVAAGEGITGSTPWTFTSAGSNSAWYMVELTDVAVADPGDGAVQTTGTIGNGATRSTGSATNAGSSGVALAFFGANKAGTTDVQSWSGYTNSFTERLDVEPGSGTAGRQIAVAWKEYSGWSTWETTATFATTAASAATVGTMVLLRSDDASINAPLDFFTGFGFGTHAGLAPTLPEHSPLGKISLDPSAPAGTWGTNYSIGLNGRNSNYALDVIASASIANVPLGILTGSTFVFGANVHAVSGSGTPVAVHFAFGGGSAGSLQLVYDVTNEKFGLLWGGGSTVWQTGTTPVGSYAWVEVRARLNSSVSHADWFIETGTGDGTQTSPTDLTGRTVITSIETHLGSTASQTSRFRFSDVVFSRHTGAYPLGPHVVRTLIPETTGATISGTSSNFQRFTSNGTLANVSGTEGALLDDIPPTISASSDGVVQVSVAASDYIQIPMTTYTLAADEIIAAVRAFASLWGGTGTGTGTLGFRGHDGTTETTFVAAGTSFDPDSLTTASATYPKWYAAMWPGGVNGAWTPTRLADAVLRGGFSTDATPDMGFSCMGLEVATRQAKRWIKYRLVDGEDPDDYQAAVYEYLHPYNSNVQVYEVDNQDLTRTCRFAYTAPGESEVVVTAAPGTLESTTVPVEAAGTAVETTFSWVV